MQPARRLHAGWLCLPLGQDKVLFTEAGGVLHISSGERAACIHGCGTSQPDLRGGGVQERFSGPSASTPGRAHRAEIRSICKHFSDTFCQASLSLPMPGDLGMILDFQHFFFSLSFDFLLLSLFSRNMPMT